MVLLVRHGRTPTTGKVLPGRGKGLHLSDQGRAEAEAVAARIVGSIEVDALYTSPMERARETAAPIAKATGRKPVVDKGLLEIDNGDWTGMSLSKVAKLPEWKAVRSSPSSFRFPGGESFLEMQARVDKALGEIAAAHPSEVVICVSHTDPIKVAVVTALQAPLTSIHHIEIGTCSVTAISIAGAWRNVLTVGDSGSLKALAR